MKEMEYELEKRKEISSINPAFDMLPASENIDTMFAEEFDSEVVCELIKLKVDIRR